MLPCAVLHVRVRKVIRRGDPCRDAFLARGLTRCYPVHAPPLLEPPHAQPRFQFLGGACLGFGSEEDGHHAS
jgi:hypothetical protein